MYKDGNIIGIGGNAGAFECSWCHDDGESCMNLKVLTIS